MRNINTCYFEGRERHIGTGRKISGRYEFHKVVILFGNGLIDLFGDKVLNGMKDNNIEVLLYQEMDTVEINAIMQLGFSFPNTTEAVIGIGGGKVIDAAKYCGFLRNLPL